MANNDTRKKVWATPKLTVHGDVVEITAESISSHLSS